MHAINVVLDLIEICNGLDEDCDGRVDEQVFEVGQVCGSNVGVCQEGMTQCINGELQCQGEVTAMAELCDSVDNDCDGRFEEGLINACGQCGPQVMEKFVIILIMIVMGMMILETSVVLN